MPVYESLCNVCGQRHEYVASISNMHNTPECCGEKTEKRIFTNPIGAKIDFPADGVYTSPASGKTISSAAERKRDFQETGTRPWEGMDAEKANAKRQKEYQEAEQDKKLEDNIRKSLTQISPESRKQLGLA